MEESDGRRLDADLGTWDIIRDFQLDNYEMHRETITQIVGSNKYQTAYRFERESNLTMRAQEAFPRGTPFQFSFECTYRSRQPQSDPWHIFHLTNQYQESQLSVTLNPVTQTLAVSLPDSEGDLQTVEFRHSNVSNLSFPSLMHLNERQCDCEEGKLKLFSLPMAKKKNKKMKY